MTDKLYRVSCKGMTYATSGNLIHGVAYVVAKDPSSAYLKLRKYLDDEDYGFSKDRELDKIELVAEDYGYTDCDYRLFI